MNRATYRLLRFIPDIARNEPVNIGIFAWYEDVAIIRFDHQAIDRATARDRDAGKDVLHIITSEICSDFDKADLRDERDFLDFLEHALQGSFSSSESRPFGIPEIPKSSAPATLSNEVDNLIDRLVKPTRRRTTREPKGPRQVLEEGYKRFLAPDQLETSYQVTHTETGIVRTVDMFVNHNVDTAIEILNLRRHTSHDTAVDAADAVKAKSIDILRGHEVKLVVVHLPADLRRELGAHVPTIQQMLKTEKEIRFTSSSAENIELVHSLSKLER